MFSIRTKLLLWLLPITLALLAGLGYLNFQKSSEMTADAIDGQLIPFVEAKQAALVEYIESGEKLGASIAATEIVQTWSELTNRKLGGNNLQTLERLGLRVEDLLYSFQESHWGRYQHIFLINQSNRVIISPNHGIREKGAPSALLGTDMSRNPWAMAAMHKGKPTLTNYSAWQSPERGAQILFYPVRDSANRVQAVIGIELQVSYQQQILRQGFDIGNSARIYLFTEDGTPVFQKGLEPQAPLAGNALAETRLNGNLSARRMNAQGREVIGYYARHKDYPWIISAEVETAEVLEDFLFLQYLLAGGLVATLVIMTILLLAIAKSIVRPLHEAISYVEKISLGEFNVEIPDSSRRDEIGKLTEALQKLVFSLQLVAKKLRDAKALKTKMIKSGVLKKAS